MPDGDANEEVDTVRYSYRDRETTGEARKPTRDRDERRRREEHKREDKKTTPEKERELVRA